METLTPILLGIIAAVVIALLIKQITGTKDMNGLKSEISDLKTKQAEAQMQALSQQQELLLGTQKVMNDQLNAIMKNVNENLSSTQKNINDQLGNTGRVINEIKQSFGAVQETASRIKELASDITSLQDMLRAPKMRGNIGEMLLEDLLGQMLPKKNFMPQHAFKSGGIVDAVIKIGDRLVPIDAKFPIEDFDRVVKAEGKEEKSKAKREFLKNVKAKIDSIAENYIKPEENTYDFALMYIPAESIYYEAVITEAFREDEKMERRNELLNYAMSKRVIPVSPNSFYAFLMAIVYGLKGMAIEERTKEIVQELQALQKDFGLFSEKFRITGKQINQALANYSESEKLASRFCDKLEGVTGIKGELPGGRE
ncbi:MAG TPA: DNA recombination protein RmuC [bacterium]|nr:DNA recombination protein RmuC [bacterium]